MQTQVQPAQQSGSMKSKATFTIGLLLGAAAGSVVNWALNSKETLPDSALDLSNKVGRLQEALGSQEFGPIHHS